MPVFRNHTILGVARNLRAFLDLKVGVTCGVTLKERAEQQERQLHQANQQIKKMRQWLNNKDEQLNTLRAKLGNEQTPVAELKAGLASTPTSPCAGLTLTTVSLMNPLATPRFSF